MGVVEEIPSVAYLCFRELPKVLARVKSSPFRCAKKECPFYRNCFYYAHLYGSRRVHILVVNHALLFSKEDVRGENLIVDEAHNFVKAGENWLIKRFVPNYVMGLVEEAKNKFSSFLGDKFVSSSAALTHSLKGILECFNRKKFEPQQALYSLNSAEERLLLSLLKKMENFLDSFEEGEVEKAKRWDADFYKEALEEQRESLHEFLLVGEGMVRWVEKGKSGLCFCVSPLSVEEYVREFLGSFRFALFTSATLVAGDEFEYFKSSLGYDGEVKTLVLGSPYDWESRVKFFFVKGINPQDKSDPATAQLYRDRLVRYLKSVIRASDGGVLVLFTSTSEMQRVYRELVAETELKSRYRILQQGRDSRRMILSHFEKYGNVVALGTKSFWEGVDFPGDKVEILCIVKTPFDNPFDPLIQAQIENYKQRGDDAFLQYQVPEAAMRFRQGFGRLIRNMNDTGICIVGDTRLYKRDYGQTILGSLPVDPIPYYTVDSLLLESQKFF
jgi:ATP-dependent DNA helicase DinG